jgi:hypothetical protein
VSEKGNERRGEKGKGKKAIKRKCTLSVIPPVKTNPFWRKCVTHNITKGKKAIKRKTDFLKLKIKIKNLHRIYRYQETQRLELYHCWGQW